MTAAPDDDAAYLEWVRAEVAQAPPLGPRQIAELRVLLDLRADPQDALALHALQGCPSPALLSESDRSSTVSYQGPIATTDTPIPPVPSITHPEATP